MSKKAGRHSQSANDFLEPMTPVIDSATDVGTNRSYNDGAVTVSFTLPENSPEATGYTVLSSGSHTATGSSSPITVTGLSSDTAYTFQVKATNAVGDSAYSTASSSVTVTTVPAAPTSVSASSPEGATYDTVSWSAPANGGKAISNYHVTGNDGTSGDTSSTSININQGAGETQSYTVYATNDNGNSASSSSTGDVTTFSFTPFSVFGFSPFGVFAFFGVFGFSPFGVFGFSPFGVFGFSPGCVDQDTLITVVGPNDTIAYKRAQEINAGDEVWTATWDELVDEDISPFSSPSDTMTNITTVKTTIQSVFPSIKSTTIYFNNDIAKRFSLEEKVLIKRDGVYSFLVTASIELGDYLVQRNEDGSYSEIVISNIQTIDEDRTVYRFNAEPVDTLLAANLIVHNIKDRF